MKKTSYEPSTSDRITLSPDRGGIFDVLLGLVRRGLGGASGSGDQFVSWVHEKDFIRAVDFRSDHAKSRPWWNLRRPARTSASRIGRSVGLRRPICLMGS